jgi:4-diphosphocytidyl-2-C-methyl-D-erythritol kinase
VNLQKRIPIAAGLAGGSSDAAATLTGLNQLWELGLNDSTLSQLASELGSDVSFFFATPAAWCTGRGEQVRKVELGTTLWFVLVCPPFGSSTASVYRSLTAPEVPAKGDAMVQAVKAGDLEAIGRLLHNRLQPAAEKLNPALADVGKRLGALAPNHCLLSGSGSSYFALCRDQREATLLEERLRKPFKEEMNARVFIVRSCLSGATDKKGEQLW